MKINVANITFEPEENPTRVRIRFTSTDEEQSLNMSGHVTAPMEEYLNVVQSEESLTALVQLKCREKMEG